MKNLKSFLAGTGKTNAALLKRIAELEARLAQVERDAGRWQTHAIAWLRQRSADQGKINEECPKHAEAYESWKFYESVPRRLADELESDAAKEQTNG